MDLHAQRKGWWNRPLKALLSLTLVASGFSAAVAPAKVQAASGTPGGGMQAPVLWLKADDGASAANGGLTGWEDRSPDPVAFTLDLPNGAKVPQYNESGVNFNPSVKFANPLSAYHYIPSAKLLGDKAITFRSGYTVYKWPESGSAGVLVGSSDQKSSNGVIVMGGYANNVSTGPGLANVYSYVPSTVRDRHQLVNYQIGEPGHTAAIDGKSTNVSGGSFTPFSFTPSIGATNAPAQYNWSGLNAEVAEIILYDTITSADAAKIETYLAVKYGITLNHDYVGTDGTLLWSKTANAAYHHNVAGLGKDNLEELDQKQSRSINKDTQVAIGLAGLAEANSGNTAVLANGQYLIWGDNGKPVKFTGQLGSTDWYQAERIWKVQNNGSVGEVEIAIPATAAPETVKLLVSDTDTDFAQATEYELSPITLGNVPHYAVKVTLKDGQFFTFAAEAPELQEGLLEQVAGGGHEIVLTFDQEMATGNLAGFSVQIADTAVPIGSITYRVDPADPKKLILTLPEGTDVKGKTVNVDYNGTGSLKSTYGAPAKPFTVSPKDQFIDSLQIIQPTGSLVTVPKPEITGEAEPGSAVAIVIKDKDGHIVTGAGGNAVVEADGKWSFTPGDNLQDGEYTIEATATKGVKSAVATKGITVNVPVPTLVITAPGGEMVTDTTPEFQGTTDPGATVTAIIKDQDGHTIGTPTVTVKADGTWSFEPEEALPYGKYTVEVTSAKNGKTNMASKTISVVDKSKLQAEMNLSSTLDEEDYTTGSWTSYESKLTTAQAVLGSATATQTEVDTALAELTAAREALVLKPVVDKSKLQAEVDRSSTLDEEDYTTGSWTSYESKLTTAQAVLGSATATQTEVDTALAELTAAREALVLKPVVDKSKLQAEVDLSSTLEEEDYTTGSWTSYESKLTTAQAVLGSATATQTEVDTALAELTAAREALVLKPVVDKSKLQAEVDLSSTLDEEDYTTGSWTSYESKLTTAQAVLGSATATQTEVETALAELTAAREALVEVPVVPVVDKTKLQAEVDLSAILDKETYTPASWASYESMLTTAQTVLGSTTATQAEVDAALEALQAAYGALVAKSGLVNITPSSGMIQPSVTASVYEYSLIVEYNVSELQLTLAAAHPGAAITVNGQAAGTGQASAAVTLNVGDNTVTIVVRETDGSDKTYTVTVRRQSAPIEPNQPSQTPYVPSNTPTPALPVVERITVDVEATGYGIVAKTEIERMTNNDGSKSDKVTFTTAKALEAVEKTLAARSTSVRIVIPDKQDIVKDVRVELPDAAVKAVQDAGLNLEIYTDNGMITIPNASLSGLNPNLYFHLIPVKQESERKQVEERARTEELVRKVLNNGNVYVVDRPMTIETNMTSRPVTITLPLNSSHVPAEASAREAYLSKLAVFIEHSDGERELVKPAVVAYGDNKLGLSFTIGKFSTFTILNLDNGAAGSHRAYMVGMPDGTFKPENALTRAQVAMILYRVLELQGANAAQYSDVSGSHWAAEAIRQVTGAGLMKGMTDGSFRPEQGITRAEMAVIIARWKALSGTGEHSYNDALGHWAEKAIGQTKEAGYMEGMTNGRFQPDKALTRAEGVTVFNRILERGPLYGETVPLWSDVPTIHWAFHQIEEASQDHSYTSRPEGGEMIIKQ
ncbi:FIVAR domain-containing protein [Paenibacillus tritici]|uniref:S-layer homology domain-containing protein n=1 Tax=Paenibacillus tritici TaxID=1873425 RepID=UPI001BA81DD0|nr:S-layer homology domain-containing protein [Paenibacillus tritici]QUL52753.1 FIVAR domain-containing protein [Paenibacillus tritici]